jgi:hypothetical protein
MKESNGKSRCGKHGKLTSRNLGRMEEKESKKGIESE